MPVPDENLTIARKPGMFFARVARVVLKVWSLLPLWLVHGVGACLGWLTWLCSPGYRVKLRRHFAAAGVGKSVQRKAIAEIGRWAAETPWIWWRPVDEVAAMVQGDWQPVADALAVGKGLIILTPHMGSFEAAARSISCRFPITVMYKPPRQFWLAQVLEGARATSQIKTAPASLAGVKQLVRFLREGAVTAILPDQVPGEDEGEWASMFGQRAYTMTLPTRLATLSKSPIVLLTCLRKPHGGGWALHFESIQQPQNAQDVNDMIERLILKFPEQYLWGYNRFREPRKEAR